MRITLPSGTPAELSRGRGSSTWGVVVAPDIMGLRALFDELCARLAEEHGWTVCAVEPFAGQEGASLDERLYGGVAGLRDEKQLGDLTEGADATGCERVDVIGFCMGGMYALKAAAAGRFQRAVSFYGMIRVPEQ